MSANSTEEVLSESDQSIMPTKTLTGLEWMEGMEDEGSGWSVALETWCCVHGATLDNNNRARFVSSEL